MKRRLLFTVLALMVAIQFIPVERTNPPVGGEIQTPPEIGEIFERSCYDCHSNETVWPWYSSIAPASWLVARDVELGRGDLDFSEWSDYTNDERSELLEEIGEEVKAGEMPLWFYLPLHPDARLSIEEVGEIVQWSARTAAEPSVTVRVDRPTGRGSGERGRGTNSSSAPASAVPTTPSGEL